MNYIIKYILASSSKDNKLLFFNIKQYIIYCNDCNNFNNYFYSKRACVY